jgi:hypothetical protein
MRCHFRVGFLHCPMAATMHWQARETTRPWTPALTARAANSGEHVTRCGQ